MTPQEFRALLERLGLSQQAAARLLGVKGRTVQSWCAPPGPDARAVNPIAVSWLTYIHLTGEDPGDVARVLGRSLGTERDKL